MTRRVLVGPVVLALTLSTMAFASVDRATAVARPTPPVAVGPEGAALRAARASGRAVRADALTTETTEVFARPDGQMEARISAGVARVRRGEGWVPLDLALARAEDGSIAPGAHPNDLRLSDAQTAGTHELAAVGRGSARVAMSWTGALPEPALDGVKATYVDALPGVDLVVEATDVGFSQSLVVKRREAAGAVARVTLPLTGPGVAGFRRGEGGAVTLTGEDGGTVATVPTPTMWDARQSPAGTPVRKLPVGTSARGRSGGVDLVLEPDAGWLADPDTVYPVTVDPTVIPLSTTYDTYIREDSTADLSGESDLWLGYYPTTPPTVARSLLTWDTTALVGKQINSATFSFYNFWSHTCTATAWELWRVGPIYSTTRWANQPEWLDGGPHATSTQTTGSTNCADGWVTVDGKSFLQRTATAGLTRSYMGLKAANETTAAGFKQFRSRENADSTLDPKAVVTYNAWPTVASRATVPATACVTGTGRPLVNTLTPQLKATVSDGDGTAMSVEFEWWTVGGSARLGGQTVAGVASGGTATATVPAGAFADGGRYQWRVRASDGVADSAVWSPFCEMTTYVTAPPVEGCQDGGANDFDGDGVTDTAIGAPKAAVDGLAGAGVVRVVSGATGTATTLREGAGGVPDTAAAGEQFGRSLAVLDANNDGCADLAVGAPYEDSGTVADAGRVFLIYGAPAGLGAGPASLLIEQGRVLEQSRGTVPDAPEAGDWFGFALAAGRTAVGEPFLVIGAPGEDIGAAADAGKVHYLRGTTNIAFDESQVGAGGLENDDRFGYALAATAHQFAIAQPGESIGTAVFSGSVCLYTHTITSALPGRITCVYQGLTGVSEASEPGDQFGRSIAMVPYRPAGASAGVANSMLVIGVPGEDLAGVSDTGMVQQFLVTPTAVTELAALSQASAGVAGDNAAGDYFGQTVVAVNTNPAAEASPSTVQIAVGAPGKDLGGRDAGEVHVFAGGTTAIGTDTEIYRRDGALSGAPIVQELLGAWLGANPSGLLVASPYGDGARSVTVHPWASLAAGSAAPATTYESEAAAFGIAIG